MTNRKKEMEVNLLVFKPLYNYLRQNGLDSVAEKVLQVAGVEREQIGSYIECCSIEKYYAAFHQAILMTGDKLLGLHIGQSLHPSNMGLLGYAMCNCSTIKDALYLVLSSNAQGFGNDIVQFDISLQANGLLKMTMQTEEEPDLVRPWIEFTTAGWLSHYNHLTNFAYKDKALFEEVSFSFPSNGYDTEYYEVLGCKVLFEQQEAYITVNSEVFNQQIYAADKGTLALFLDHLGISSIGNSMKDKVRKCVQQALPHTLSIDEVASGFCISVSTLKRKLKEEGVTFNETCSHLKMDMAKVMLRRKELSIQEISFYLGYSKPAAFFRAFKRLMGVTPNRYRES